MRLASPSAMLAAGYSEESVAAAAGDEAMQEDTESERISASGSNPNIIISRESSSRFQPRPEATARKSPCPWMRDSCKSP